MTKEIANINSSILNLISTCNSISKCMGFAVTKSNDTFFSKFVREIIFLWLLFFAIYCTVFAELWCIKFLGLEFDVRKVVFFVISQMVNLSPLSCLLYFRQCNLPVWKIILKVKHLEENLKICNTCLEIRRISFVVIFFWIFQFSTVTTVMVYSLWSTLTFFIFDALSMFYFEAWVTVPYLQFIAWICFLCYVSYRVQCKIIEINELEYLTRLDICRVKYRLDRIARDECRAFDKVEQIKKIIHVMKQVLSIAKELSTVYGITVLLYIANYVSRLIIQFYDLLDRHSQMLPLSIGIFNALVRLMFILPVFICCEHLSHNINKAVELIQEIVSLHQPSCLDCIFQSLTLRLQHQNTTTQICGFLNMTYSSFLTIMATALAFLLLQLQFIK